MNGVEAAKSLSKICPVVMLTHSEDHEVINAALRNGARGYVVYNEIEMQDLSRALHSVAAGASLMSSSAVTAVMSGSGGAQIAPDQVGEAAEGLQIMELVADGLPNKEIAGQLFLNEKTVKYHTNRQLRQQSLKSILRR